MIESIRDFFKTCPHLKNGLINFNFLGEKPVRYSIESVPVGAVLKRYTDGGTLRQLVFNFVSRENYGAEPEVNLAAAGFYEKLADWVERQDDLGNLPALGEDAEPLRLEVLKSGCLKNGTFAGARYELQCRLIYFKAA